MRKTSTYSKTGPFIAATIVVFFMTLSALHSIGFVPYYVDGTDQSYVREGQEGRMAEAATHEYAGPWNPDALPEWEGGQAESARSHPRANLEAASGRHPIASSNTARSGTNNQQLGVGIHPERITIHAIDLDLRIQNPTSTHIDDLDAALLNGPVRYPGSGLLGEDGNMFIFGHSSSLAVVRNQMFKAFNRLPDLKVGDTINIQGGGKEYIYRVHTVRLTDANEELVDLSPVGGARLTLTTCNTFGAKSERWIVEADLVGSYTGGN